LDEGRPTVRDTDRRRPMYDARRSPCGTREAAGGGAACCRGRGRLRRGSEAADRDRGLGADGYAGRGVAWRATGLFAGLWCWCWCWCRRWRRRWHRRRRRWPSGPWRCLASSTGPISRSVSKSPRRPLVQL